MSFSTSCMVAGVKLERSGTVTLLTVSPTGTDGESVESSLVHVLPDCHDFLNKELIEPL